MDKIYATLSADIVDSTSLSAADTIKLKELLEDDKIFGVNLFEAGLADRVLGYFLELIAGKGAVRATLKKYVH